MKIKLSHLFKFTVNSVPTTYVVLVGFSVSIVSDRRDTMIVEDASFFQTDYNNLPLTFYILEMSPSQRAYWLNKSRWMSRKLERLQPTGYAHNSVCSSSTGHSPLEGAVNTSATELNWLCTVLPQDTKPFFQYASKHFD